MSWTSREIDDPGQTSWPRRIALACAVFVGLCVVGFWLVAGGVNRRLAAIRQRGEPVTYAELSQWIPPIAPDRDATRLWLEAANELQTAVQRADFKRLPILGEGVEPPLPGEPWPGLDYAEQFVLDNAETLVKAHQAADLGGEGDFRQYITPDAISTLLTPIQNLRSAARALQLEAEIHAHRGQPQEAALAIRDILRQTHSLDREPFLVSQLIRCAILGMGIGQLQKTLGRVEFSDNDLAQLDETLRNIDMARAIKIGMVGERVYGLATFDDVSFTTSNWTFMLTRPLRPLDKGMYLDVMGEFIAAADSPWPELLSKYDSIGAGIKVRLSPLHAISSNILPALSMFANACARSETARRVAIAAIALERYRRAAGHPAPDLAALVPKYLAEVPTDPTSGLPLDYQVKGDSYVVFSPSKRFPSPRNDCGDTTDVETGANPLLLFRWPPRAEEPCVPKDAEGEDEQQQAGDAAQDGAPPEEAQPQTE